MVDEHLGNHGNGHLGAQELLPLPRRRRTRKSSPPQPATSPTTTNTCSSPRWPPLPSSPCSISSGRCCCSCSPRPRSPPCSCSSPSSASAPHRCLPLSPSLLLPRRRPRTSSRLPRPSARRLPLLPLFLRRRSGRGRAWRGHPSLSGQSSRGRATRRRPAPRHAARRRRQRRRPQRGGGGAWRSAQILPARRSGREKGKRIWKGEGARGDHGRCGRRWEMWTASASCVKR